jgi:hypothetical protein
LLFVKQTYDGWPTKVIFEDIKWQTLMCNGIKDINNSNIVERKNILLKHLDVMLYKNLSDYGFPKVEKDYTELSYIVSKNIKKNHQQVSVFYYVWAALIQEIIEHNPKFDLYPFLTSGKWHLIHHHNTSVNYGLFIPVWDMLFGTFKSHKEAQ